MSTTAPTTRQGQQVDVRGPRFAAWITTAVLVVVLAVATVSTTVAGVLLAVQTAVFAAGAALGPRRSPYGLLFARLVAPRLSALTEKEPVAPLRFAQLVGFVFAAVGTFGFLLGADLAGLVATGFALFAALLNAAFGVCLGCAIYPLVARFRAVAA
ncbi:DUF4395 domain-containing protein [Rhodococcus aetherivorans]|uniref:DUF4395 domain-containing protein n=1 Tax=Rhodococcus aetherivorans TaxID=191292 RepID=A0AA46NUF7_9NOCA|nr:DUF4395 domain-containing protein [Rhodococcus aetherivorans]UYF93413.1 DUF4395 domain-containing protein [Rhodococcus aetherivorans]